VTVDVTDRPRGTLITKFQRMLGARTPRHSVRCATTRSPIERAGIKYVRLGQFLKADPALPRVHDCSLRQAR